MLNLALNVSFKFEMHFKRVMRPIDPSEEGDESATKVQTEETR